MLARRLLIGSVANMRELGGYATLTGEVTKYKRFIRSNLLSGLTGEDIAFLKDYGLKTVVDLRTPFEIENHPSDLAAAEGMDYLKISFLEDFDSVTGGFYFSPADHYVPMVKEANRIKEILSAMARAKEGAVLFNCSAGKDRTGIIAAILLLIAGVPREDIVADYQVTFTYIKGIFGPRIEAGERALDFCRSDCEWMESLLDYFEQRGGAESFLTQDIGLEAHDIERLRQRFLN